MDAQYGQFVSTKEACIALKITPETLRRWEKNGKIIAARTPGGQRRYNLKKYFCPTEHDIPDVEGCGKGKIIYARVSTREQKADLERQVGILRRKYPDYELIKDIGSGLSFKRKGIKTLVERIFQGEITEIVVTHKDRLCRFGFEFFELILSQSNQNAKIVVLDDRETSPEQELTDDLLAIITVFSSRLYGLRSHKNTIKDACKNPKNSIHPDQQTEKDTNNDVSAIQMEL